MYILVLNQHHIKLAVLKAACIHSHIGVLSKGSFLYQSFLQLLKFLFFFINFEYAHPTAYKRLQHSAVFDTLSLDEKAISHH